MAQQIDQFKKVISHAKEYGFVFPSSEIYDGLSAVYDYAQNGSALKNNIREYWWKSMVQLNENIVGIDAAIFMHPTTWKASGHVDAFNDPLIDNKVSKKRYRADVLVEDYVAKIETKIEKEVAKAAKRFGDTFDEKQFKETNPRVLGYQETANAILKRLGRCSAESDSFHVREVELSVIMEEPCDRMRFGWQIWVPQDEVKCANHKGRLDLLEMSIKKQNLLLKTAFGGILFVPPPGRFESRPALEAR